MKQLATEAGSSPSYRRISTKMNTKKLRETEHCFTDNQLWKSWPSDYRCAIGVSLIELCKSLGIVDTQLVKRGKKNYKFLNLTPQVAQLQNDMFDNSPTAQFDAERRDRDEAQQRSPTFRPC